jgi:hypothetical protein
MRMVARQARGVNLRTLGNTITDARSSTPWMIVLMQVRAPASTLAAVRTTTDVIGSVTFGIPFLDDASEQLLRLRKIERGHPSIILNKKFVARA